MYNWNSTKNQKAKLLLASQRPVKYTASFSYTVWPDLQKGVSNYQLWQLMHIGTLLFYITTLWILLIWDQKDQNQECLIYILAAIEVGIELDNVE